MPARILLAVALIALMGCDNDDGNAPAPAPPPAETQAPEKAPEPPPREATDQRPRTPLNNLMRAHFMRGSQARDALIRGDIDAAKVAMNWLGTHDLGSAVPEELRPNLEPMQAQAREFANATTLREAGLAMAKTLVKCGNCHTQAHRGPEFAEPPLPEGDDRRAHMRRHEWAARRMWEGLVTNDRERFDEGAQALQGAPLHAEDLPADEDEAQQVEALTEHVHELARESASAETQEDRADIYGHFIATCATCHRLLGTGGPPQDMGQNEPTNL